MELTIYHVASGIGVLLTAIGTLWGLTQKQQKETKEKLEGEVQSLRDRRDEDSKTVLELSVQVAAMKNYRLGIEDLSAKVLDEVRSLKEKQ